MLIDLFLWLILNFVLFSLSIFYFCMLLSNLILFLTFLCISYPSSMCVPLRCSVFCILIFLYFYISIFLPLLISSFYFLSSINFFLTVCSLFLKTPCAYQLPLYALYCMLSMVEFRAVYPHSFYADPDRGPWPGPA